MSRCSRGTPRIANRILKRMRDFAQVWGSGVIDKPIVKRGLESLEIDARGLDKVDREILRTLVEKYAGGPGGSETIAISIGEAVDTLEDVYEPYLIQIGFLKRTPRRPCRHPGCLGRHGHPVVWEVKTSQFSFDLPEELIAQEPGGSARRSATPGAGPCLGRFRGRHGEGPACPGRAGHHGHSQ